MLTRLRIRNFKGFDDVDIELGRSVVFVGPNNSGKTSALQALSLWEVGLRKWQEKYADRQPPEKRPGVTVGRRDLLAIPAPAANFLWRGLRTQKGARPNGKSQSHVLIEITVDGELDGKAWSCGLEFDYANEESIYCRPLRISGGDDGVRMPVPVEAQSARVAMLPPMSGLAASEPLLLPGRVEVLIGEGQTAQVLRNLCYALRERLEGAADWDDLVRRVRGLFAVELLAPELNQARGEISMSYRDRSGTELDLSCSGRGLQQTLLLLAYLYSKPGTALLLDEPDAHLEVLRQREIYDLLTDLARAKGCQIIAASHSEVVLAAAADRDVVIAFVGRPHRIDDRGPQQVLKALKSIGHDQYLFAQQTGWVLYVEGETDLKILKAFAHTLGHAAEQILSRAFVRVLGSNVPNAARDHFHGLREAVPDLVGMALFDRIDKAVERGGALDVRIWERREIENYVAGAEPLLAYAARRQFDDMFDQLEAERRTEAMRSAIADVEQAVHTLRRGDLWSPDRPGSEALDAVLARYFERLERPNEMRKSDYHELAALMPRSSIPEEVVEVLDAIVSVAKRAKPVAPPTEAT